MAAQASPPFMRRKLGRQLRQSREQAGMSFTEAYQRLEFSSATLSRIENGKTAPTVHTVRSMLDLYLVPANDWDELLDLVRQARATPWWKKFASSNARYPSLVMGFVELESAASVEHVFGLTLVPGILQTEAYARAILGTSLMGRTPQQFEGQVAMRMGRQRRLFQEREALRVHAVLDEELLWRRVGSVEVMVEQLTKIEEAGQSGKVTVQVLPLSSGEHRGFASAFTILDFPWPEEDSLVFIEHVAGAVTLRKRNEVSLCEQTFATLGGKALDPQDSLDLVKDVRIRQQRYGWPVPSLA